MNGPGETGAWEYLTLAEAERERLSALGAEGWELVGVGGKPEDRVLYLKRPGPTLRERVTLDQRAAYYDRRRRESEGSAG